MNTWIPDGCITWKEKKQSSIKSGPHHIGFVNKQETVTHYWSSRRREESKGFGRWSCVVAVPWFVADERWSLQRNEPSCFVGAHIQIVFPSRLLLLSRPSESVDHDFLIDNPVLFLLLSSSFTRLNGFLVLNEPLLLLLVRLLLSSAMNQIVKLGVRWAIWLSWDDLKKTKWN